MSDTTLIIKDIVQGAEGRWIGPAADLDRPVAKVATDSRTIGSGDVFFALAGERFDGHDFALQALQAGAIAVVVAEGWFQQQRERLQSQPFIMVPDTLAAFQEAARAYRRRFKIPVAAVTGSAGKTSAKEAVYSVLSQRYRALRNKKSFNNHVGVPATLFELRPHHEILLSELGANHFGELDRLSYLVEPDIALILNIGHAHLEFFQDLQGVLRAKSEIFNHCKRDAVAMYNADDPLLREFRYPLKSIFSYALRHKADLSAKIIDCDRRAAYRIELLGETVRLPVSGRHNVYNALAAAAVALQFQMTPQEIKAGLETLQAVEKRMEVFDIGRVTVLNDSYNANPDSCHAAMATLAEMETSTSGRRIAVLADMLELGGYTAAEHGKLADVFKSFDLDLLLLYGQASEFTLQRARRLGIAAHHFHRKEDLISALEQTLTDGDVVLVKGSRGMQMETVVEGLQAMSANSKKDG